MVWNVGGHDLRGEDSVRETPLGERVWAHVPETEDWARGFPGLWGSPLLRVPAPHPGPRAQACCARPWPLLVSCASHKGLGQRGLRWPLFAPHSVNSPSPRHGGGTDGAPSVQSWPQAAVCRFVRTHGTRGLTGWGLPVPAAPSGVRRPELWLCPHVHQDLETPVTTHLSTLTCAGQVGAGRPS